MQSTSDRTPVGQWLQVMNEEYLSSFVALGGSTVRFVAGDDEVLDKIRDGLRASAKELSYHVVDLDAGELNEENKKPDYHRIEKLFFRVSETIDWKRHATNQVVKGLEEKGIRFPDGVARDNHQSIAEFNGRDPADLLNTYQRLITDLILKDRAMTVEFRIAITALGRSQLISEELTPTTEDLLLGWLRGEKSVPGGAPTLKKIRIHERINRSNARSMLESLTHWIRLTGLSGLVVILDLRPYERVQISRSERERARTANLFDAIDRGADIEELKAIRGEVDYSSDGVRYSKQAFREVLELLRHFIDEVERFEGMALVVLGSSQFFQSSRLYANERRFFDYDALSTRIGLEVHDVQRRNPSAALVHVGGEASV